MKDSNTGAPVFSANAASESGIGRFDASDSQLRGLIEILLAENPGLSSASARSQSLSERVPQHRSLPDPQLNYRYFAKTPETRVGPQQQMLEFSQGVPWGGKRKLQASRAEFLAADFNWQIEDLERRLVADLKRAYYEAAYLQEALQVNREEQELLRRFEVISLKRYATGQGIQEGAGHGLGEPLSQRRFQHLQVGGQFRFRRPMVGIELTH